MKSAYFKTVLDNMGKVDKITPTIKHQYIMFRDQFERAKRYCEIEPEEDVKILEDRFRSIDVIIRGDNKKGGK